MRYLFLFCFLLATVAGMAQTVRIEGVEWVYAKDFPDAPLYVVRQTQKEVSPTGRIVFTPGGDGWEFGWSYKEEEYKPESYEDSTRLTVDLQGVGLYKMWAEKEGYDRVETVFNVFYDFMDFKIELDDVFNCEEIKIRIEYLDLPEFQGNPGMENVDCWVIWDGNERQLVSLNDYAYHELSQSVAGCFKDVFCSVRIKDRFGLTWESEAVKYESVIPKAEAELELLNTVDVVGEVNEEMGQAPLEVVFHSDKSLNADSYEWLLFKDTADLNNVYVPDLRDSLIGSWIQDEFAYTYEHTGRYKVQLIAENGQGNRCRDTSKAYYVNVVESRVDVPNVFTPNGDGKNDVFMALALSVEHFHGVILNRLGRKVYEWSDPNGGWDGRIHGKYATPGTYYYIITARGLEKNNPPRYVKKGALMLIR